MKISVVGCGFLGAVYAAAMASLGHDVVGIDVDQRKLDVLAAGQAPFYEPAVDEAVAGAEGLLLLTEWHQFRALDPAELKTRLSVSVMIDGRNILDPLQWRAPGWSFGALGRP